MTTKTVIKSRAAIAALIVSLAVLAVSCRTNETVLRSGSETPLASNAVTEKSAFAQELSAMHTAGFTYVYVLRRKDNGVMDSDNIGAIKVQTAKTNRRIMSDNDHAVIIGSNNPVPADNLAALYQRFSVEDYSEPPPVDANMNTNSVK